MPLRSELMIASSEDSTIAASNAASSGRWEATIHCQDRVVELPTHESGRI